MSLIPIDEVVYFDVTTHNVSTGAVSDADSGPTFDVFEESTDTPILDDQSMTKRTSLTGNYRGNFTASAANGFEAGKWYSVIATATVNSVTGKIVVKNFRVGPAESSAGVPKVDTSHLGGTSQTGRDIGLSVLLSSGTGTGQISLSSGAVLLQATQAGVTIPTVTTLTNAPSDSSGVTTLLSRIPSGLFTGITSLAQWLGAAFGKQAANSTARTEIRATGAGSGTFDETTDSLEAVRDNMGTAQTGDTFSRLGAPAGASIAADIAAIEAQTDDIGTAGAGLTAVPWNSAWDAEVQSEVQDAIEANHLDHLLATTYDPASKPGAADALLNELVESDAGVARFTANALEQAPTGGSAPTAADIADAVWEEAIADHSGTAGSTAEALNAAGSAGDPWVTALPGAYSAGQAGHILGTNLNATVSSRATPTQVATELGTYDAPTKAELDAAVAPLATAANLATVDGIVDDILADTADMQPKIGTPAGASVSADIAAVKAQTAAIEVDTQDLQAQVGVDGAGLTALGDTRIANLDATVSSRATPAQVNTEADQALADVGVTTTITGRIDAAVSSRLATAGYTAPPSAATNASAVRTELGVELARVDAAVSTRATPAEVNAEVVDALNVDTYAEPTGAPPATASLVRKIGQNYKHLRNEVTQTATTQTLKNDGGTTDITATVSDDGSQFTRGEWS